MKSLRKATWLLLGLVAMVWGLPLSAGAAPAAGPSQIEGFVSAVDSTTLTVALRNNDKVRVAAKLTDLKSGMRVVVRGASNPDGSLVAASITADALPK